jgi:hypothetical protein
MQMGSRTAYLPAVSREGRMTKMLGGTRVSIAVMILAAVLSITGIQHVFAPLPVGPALHQQH